MANKIIALQLPLGFLHLLLLKCYAKSLSHHEVYHIMFNEHTCSWHEKLFVL